MDLGTAQMLVAITAGVISAFTAALALGWKVRGWIAAIDDRRVAVMEGFESRFNTRHEENLSRFAAINERLARMGNGSR